MFSKKGAVSLDELSTDQSSSTDIVIDDHNVQEVLQQSMHKPMIVGCWSPKVTGSRESVDAIGKLVARFGDRIVLARLNVDDHPMISQQLGAVRSPSFKVIAQGQLLAELSGSESQEQLLSLFTQMAGSPPDESAEEPELADEASNEADLLLAQVEHLLAEGKSDEARSSLQSALNQADESSEAAHSIRFRLARLLVDGGELDAATALGQSLDSDSEPLKQIKALVDFGRAVSTLPPLQQLQKRLHDDSADADALYGCGVYAVLALDFDLAQEHFFHLLIKNSQSDQAKQSLISLMALMGSKHPRVKSIQRRLFSLLH